MVFKRVLKGIGRLMLTTAVMCGVGLFLCSSEVKAADVNVTLSEGNETNGNPGGFTVTVSADSGADISKITKIELTDGTDSLCSLDKNDLVDASSESKTFVYKITSSDFLKQINKISISSDGKDFTPSDY